MNRSKEECLRDYENKQNGLRILVQGSTNYYFEAVLIALLNVASFSQYFILEKYSESDKRNISDYFNWLCIAMT